MPPIVPPGFNFIQQPSLQYNKPVSEASLDALGSSINGLLSVLLPVGSVLDSVLTEAQFQAQIGNPSPATWILADGRNISGSLLAIITGFSSAPDLRGITTRGKNNGRSDGNQNPDGELAIGTYTASRFTSHNHGVTDPAHDHNFGIGKNGSDNQSSSPPYGSANGTSGSWTTATHTTGITINNTGGNDTAPANVTVNIFIRIN